MSKAILLQHDELYPPGRLLTVFRDVGIPCEVRRLYKGDAVPTAELDEARLLVLLGGRQRVADVSFAQRYPYLAAEVEAAKRFIAQDRPIVGIGFGAELLSHAGGGKVSENRKPGPDANTPGEVAPEHGWVPISFPFPGGTEPAVFGMVDGTPFFTWHADAFAPPALPPPANPPPPPARPPTGNVVMAASRACKVQAYRFKQRVFGYQFHFELDREAIDRITDARIGEAGGATTADQLRADATKHYARYDRAGTRLVENLVQFLRAY